MPANFREEIKGLAQKKGGTLEISGEARNIERKVLSWYTGGIEENCSMMHVCRETGRTSGSGKKDFVCVKHHRKKEGVKYVW